MNERLYWGGLVLIALTILQLSALLRHYLTIRGSIAARTMLNKERLTASSKGQSMPEADPYPLLVQKDSRMLTAPLAKLVVVPGLLLSFGGLGLGIGLLCSKEFMESGSFALVPLFLGGGLLVYLWIAKSYFKQEWPFRVEDEGIRGGGSSNGAEQAPKEPGGDANPQGSSPGSAGVAVEV